MGIPVKCRESPDDHVRSEVGPRANPAEGGTATTWVSLECATGVFNGPLASKTAVRSVIFCSLPASLSFARGLVRAPAKPLAFFIPCYSAEILAIIEPVKSVGTDGEQPVV